MQISFKNTISSVAKYLPDDVISLPVLRALDLLSPSLGTTCSSFYYEWHLANPKRLDLLCSLVYENRNAFINLVTSGKKGASATSARYDITHTISRWDTLHATLGDRVSHLWLAYDYLTEHATFDTPNIHYCIDRNFTNRSRERGYINRLSSKVFNKTADTILAATVPGKTKWPSSQLKRYYRLIHALDGEIIHLSFMHSRNPPTAKLNMTIPATALHELLTAVSWQGNIAAVCGLCTIFTPGELRIKGNICITEQKCSRFELELEYNTPLLSDPRRAAMLSSLEAAKLATPKQIKVMKTWAGREDVPYRNSHYTCERWLDCKIYFLPDGTAGAKPYFGFAPLPRIGWNRDTLYD